MNKKEKADNEILEEIVCHVFQFATSNNVQYIIFTLLKDNFPNLISGKAHMYLIMQHFLLRCALNKKNYYIVNEIIDWYTDKEIENFLLEWWGWESSYKDFLKWKESQNS